MSFYGDITRYLRASSDFERTTGTRVPRPELWRRFPAWRHSFSGSNPMADQKPWITFSALKFLESYLASSMKVFEYGGGGSTLFFLQRAAEVATTEHDVDWGRKVEASVSANDRKRWTMRCIPPIADPSAINADPASPEAPVSAGEGYRGMSFRQYVDTIREYKDELFDVVLVDGRARPACMVAAAPKVRPGGCLILDNAERPHYKRVEQLFNETSGWQLQDFSGPGPYVRQFWQTLVWIKRQ